MYNDIVDFEIAELLDNRIHSEKKYTAGKGDAKTYDAPTYAQVLDWLYEEHGLIVEFRPSFTFALKERVAYYYTVWEKDEVDARVRVLFTEDMEMSSFGLVIKEILRKLYNIEK